ncbi:L-amino-acid oxidase [Channa argus]|uniref:L-amino-acid oxidase n=1 Tax=Channa argus TaxID=215402 RepID=A0A6G1Q714_CHAAH|nr:L-amino-acid oxidase [Channa argus]
MKLNVFKSLWFTEKNVLGTEVTQEPQTKKSDKSDKEKKPLMEAQTKPKNISNKASEESKTTFTSSSDDQDLPTNSRVIVDEIDPNGKYIRLRNTFNENQTLGNWKLDLEINKKSNIYKFSPGFILNAEEMVTVYTVFIIVLLLTLYHSHTAAVSLREKLPECMNDKDYDDLLHTVKAGLPHIKTSHHVVSVGAHVAGLTAAKLLQDAGHKITIFEASGCVGGRVETYRNEKEGWYAELGAMRIPIFHNIVVYVAETLGVKLNEFIMDDPNTFYCVNGQQEKTSTVQSNPDILRYNVLESEKGKSADALLQQALNKVITEMETHGCVAALKKYDNYSLKEFLKEEGGLSSEAVRMIGHLFNEQSLMHTALRQLFSFNHADAVLVTTTAKAALFMDFHPPLPIKKKDALRAVHYESSTKIILTFSEKFWEKDGIRGGKSITDGPSRFIYYPSHSFPKNKTIGVLLASYTWSDDALLFHGASDEDLKELALRDLARFTAIMLSLSALGWW